MSLMYETLRLELCWDDSEVAVEFMGYRFTSARTNITGDDGYIKLMCVEPSCPQFIVVFGRHTFARVDPMVFVRSMFDDPESSHNHEPSLNGTVLIDAYRVELLPEDSLKYEGHIFYGEYGFHDVPETVEVPSKKPKESPGALDYNYLRAYKCGDSSCPFLIFRLSYDNTPDVYMALKATAAHRHSITSTYPGPISSPIRQVTTDASSAPPQGFRSMSPDICAQPDSLYQCIELTQSSCFQNTNISAALDDIFSHIEKFGKKEESGGTDVKKILIKGCKETTKVYKPHVRNDSPSSILRTGSDMLKYSHAHHTLAKRIVRNRRIQIDGLPHWRVMCLEPKCFQVGTNDYRCLAHSRTYTRVSILQITTSAVKSRLKNVVDDSLKSNVAAYKIVQEKKIPQTVCNSTKKTIYSRALEYGPTEFCKLQDHEYKIVQQFYFDGSFGEETADQFISAATLVLNLMALAINGDTELDYTFIFWQQGFSLLDTPMMWNFFDKFCQHIGLRYSFETAEISHARNPNSSLKDLELSIDRLSKVGDLSSDKRFFTRFEESDSSFTLTSDQVCLYALSVDNEGYIGISESGKLPPIHHGNSDRTNFRLLKAKSPNQQFYRHFFAIGNKSNQFTFESTALLALFLGKSKGLYWERGPSYSSCRKYVNTKFSFREQLYPKSTRLINTFSCRFFNRRFVLFFDPQRDNFKRGKFDLPYENFKVFQCDSKI